RLSVSFFFCLGLATQLAQAAALPTASPAPVTALTLEDCVRIGLDQQPALAAARASLAAALAQRQALDNLVVAGLVSREVPIRRKQACQGVIIATAGLEQAEWETRYAVTRNFFSVLYAHQQEEVVKALLTRLGRYQDQAKALLKQGNPDFKVTEID